MASFANDMKSLLCADEEEILRVLNSKQFGFEKFLQLAQYDEQDIDIAMQLLAKACKSSSLRHVRRLLNMVYQYETTFLTADIQNVLGRVYSGDHSISLPRLVESYAILIKHLLNQFSCFSIARDVLPNLQNLINHLECSNMKVSTAKNAVRDVENMCIKNDRQNVCLEAPENFRDLSIFPQSRDILSCPDSLLYLRPNVIDDSYSSVEDYLDVQFRLMREDMVCTFRDSITTYKSGPKCFDNLNVLHNLTVSFPPRYTENGVYHSVSFECHKSVDWEKTKLFLPGSVVCLSEDAFCTNFIFATIMKRDPQAGIGVKCNLKITIEDDESDVKYKVKYSMIETSAYFESYRHNLNALKRLNTENFPLADCIVHLSFDNLILQHIEQATEFCLHEKCNSTKNADAEHMCKTFNVLNFTDWPTPKELKLDMYQYSAFQAALTRKLAIIQGPPGTGKTFLGVKIIKTLLENNAKTPIIVCCVTNHALDQFLERLLKYTKKMIRLGQRGSLDVLQPFTLKNLLQAVRRMRLDGKLSCSENTSTQPTDVLLRESSIIVQMLAPDIDALQPNPMHDPNFYDLQTSSKRMNDLINSLDLCWKEYLNNTALNLILSLKNFKNDLCGKDISSSNIASKLTVNMQKWLNIKNEENPYDVCKKEWLHIKLDFKQSAISEVELKCSNNMWGITLKERFILFYYWRQTCLESLEKHLHEERRTYFKLLGKRSINIDFDSNMLLNNADIIGVTMTGAAKYFQLLNLCNPAIMIIEEAAEALEGHLISSIPLSIKQLILIGDHEQLRPLPATHALAKDYNLNISLFERLFRNRAPSSTLVTQHRMRPCIANLLVPTIYPCLENFANVYEYDHILGTNHDLFFFNHQKLESGGSVNASISNEFEASFIVNIALHFLNQGYNGSQITILAMYAAQILLIRKIAAEKKVSIHITTVDNYQGEENDIVLISFVRSNDNDFIGFLKESNRVCVALSRARKGLYCVGNFNMFARKNKLFEQITEKLSAEHNIGTGFPVQCRIHKRVIYIREDSEFDSFFENGCQGVCGFKLPCGHKCVKSCHSNDLEHKFYRCLEPCRKTIVDPYSSVTSICKRLCWQPCESKKKKVKLPCGHKISINWNDEICVTSFKCQHEVDKLLSCNHLVKVPCSEKLEQCVCRALVPVKLNCGHVKSLPCGYKGNCEEIYCDDFLPYYSPCGHSVDLPCYMPPDDDTLISYCKKPCDSLLNCGHACVGLCGACIELGIHSLCSFKCDLSLPCGHACQGACGAPCLPCEMKCSLNCIHSPCHNPCSKPCVECREPCMRSCSHQKCTLFCYEMCNVSPCEEPCLKLLDCGHHCIGLCGDPCPPLCRICNLHLLKSKYPGIDLYVLLEDCNHVIEVKTLERFIDESISTFTWPCCPTCGAMMTKNSRFSDHLKQSKKLLLQSCDFQEEIQNVEYRFHTMFGEHNIATWRFQNIKQQIQHILERRSPSEASLTILNAILVNLERLVYVEKKLESNSRLESKLETLIMWMCHHLEDASYQQFSELEAAVCFLEKLLSLP